MCGIGFYWARERTIDRVAIRKLFEGAAKRGGDGFGYSLIRPNPGEGLSRVLCSEKIAEPKFWDTHVLDIESNMRIGDLLFLAFRATPETELQTTPEMLQPIISPETGCVLIHNGSVTETDNKELRSHEEIGTFKWNTQIDSEAIIAQYVNYGRDMKKCMEDLSGAFAFVLLDWKSKKLYAVNSFLPLAHMYIKGYGYFLHSSNEALGEVLQDIVGTSQDGMNVWEYWYHHYLDGYTIIETDLDSGFQRKYNYRPKFLHIGIFSEKAKNPTSIYISASGGIDSGVTTLALKHFLPEKKFNICMVHFKYGQRGQGAEEWAVRKLSDAIGVQLKILDISSLYSDFIKDYGMLMNKSNAIQSGGDKLKSTIAWVSGRNALFASLLLAKAESRMLYHRDRKVLIAGGWAQLSEETGGYPDNSFKFIESLKEIKKYGYITGQDINFLNVLQNLTKTETWKLGHYLHFPFQYSCSCFLDTCWTHMNMGGGGIKRIKDVKVGDELKAWDGSKVTTTTVKKVMTRQTTEFLIIKTNVKSGRLYVTEEHPFFVVGKGWVKAGDLSKGDVLLHMTRWDCTSEKGKKIKSNQLENNREKAIQGTNKARKEGRWKISETGKQIIREKMLGDRNPLRSEISNIVKKKITNNGNYLKTRGCRNKLAAPTSSEKRYIDLLVSNGIKNVKFVSGTFHIGNEYTGRIYPDFIVQGTNKLIEVTGCCDSNYRGSFSDYKEKRKKVIESLGFSVLILDMRTPDDFLIKKTSEFIHNGITVISIEKVTIGKGRGTGNWGKSVTVYNFHCEPHNNYFVNRALVHNCDNPTIDIDEVPCLCLECGSTKLSCIAADRADVHDPRRFNHRRDDLGKGVYYRPRFSEPAKPLDINSIIKRLVLPKVD